MRIIHLRRVTPTESMLGVFGVLVTGARPIAVTVELPYRSNEINISCIPPGVYRCERIESPNFGNTFQVMDVRGRTEIVFHKANTIEDLKGCIGVASSFGMLHELPAALKSKDGFKAFLYEMKNDQEFELWITE